MPVSDTQKASISETLFYDYLIATSDGECELFKPLTDDAAERSRPQPDLTQLNFYARRDGGDRFAAFRVDPKVIGRRVLGLLAASDPARLPYRPGELVAARAR